MLSLSWNRTSAAIPLVVQYMCQLAGVFGCAYVCVQSQELLSVLFHTSIVGPVLAWLCDCLEPFTHWYTAPLSALPADMLQTQEIRLILNGSAYCKAAPIVGIHLCVCRCYKCLYGSFTLHSSVHFRSRFHTISVFSSFPFVPSVPLAVGVCICTCWLKSGDVGCTV